MFIFMMHELHDVLKIQVMTITVVVIAIIVQFPYLDTPILLTLFGLSRIFTILEVFWGFIFKYEKRLHAADLLTKTARKYMLEK